jgi:hypothetical protein
MRMVFSTRARRVVRSMRLKFRDIVVPAISEDVLPGVLKRLGLYDDVINGKATCYICGKQLTLETIGAIAMINDKPVLICTRPSCIGRASLLINQHIQKYEKE